MLTPRVAFLVDLAVGTWRGDRDQAVESRLRPRRRPPPRPTRGEKLPLAVLTAKPARLTAGPWSQLDRCVLRFKPAMILKWPRELIRRK